MLFTSKKRIPAKMGFISDQEGIITRYLREQEGWNSHLQNTKQYIEKHTIGKGYQSIGILGSGWLLDVPMEILSSQFEAIYLYDIYHPKQIKYKYRNHKNIHFIEADITGGLIEGTYNYCKQKDKRLLSNIENIVIPQFSPLETIDCMISVNILNQLDILLVDYLTQHYNFTESQIITFRKSVQKAHVDLLKKYNFCLITDFEERIYDLTGIFEIKKTLIHTELPISTHKTMWEWKFDSSALYYENKKVSFTVVGLTN